MIVVVTAPSAATVTVVVSPVAEFAALDRALPAVDKEAASVDRPDADDDAAPDEELDEDVAVVALDSAVRLVRIEERLLNPLTLMVLSP